VPKILRARPPHDDGEERKVRRLAGARHAPADWSERARIITLSWDGLGVPAIAGRLGCHPKKVRRWLHRFNADGAGGGSSGARHWPARPSPAPVRLPAPPGSPPPSPVPAPVPGDGPSPGTAPAAAALCTAF